jgi:D-beta-D-heptose 7-phosphate kinase/D-beta-D-heptose 1-phosphate adenosyltransferase
VLASEAKIVSDLAQLDCLLAQWRQQDLRIGFTNGVFDLLHPGHVKVLAAARAVCDRLVVGLNSDASAKRLKAEDRPIQDERARAEVLASLEAVDAIAVFSDNTPIELISRVRPNVLVTGSDYRRDQAVGVDLVKAHGGKVILVDVVKGFSTTRIV